MLQKNTPNSPQRAQESKLVSQWGPKMLKWSPKGPQRIPKAPKRLPKTSQKHPKEVPGASKTIDSAREGHQNPLYWLSFSTVGSWTTSKDSLGCLWDCLWEHFEVPLRSLGVPLGSIWVPLATLGSPIRSLGVSLGVHLAIFGGLLVS